MILTYKYRLYPNKTQDKQLDFMLWQARQVYNASLERRINYYQETGETLSWMTIRNEMLSKRREMPDTWGQLPAATLDDTVRRMHKSFENFWRRVKSGTEAPGFPKFKGRYNFFSMGFIPTKYAVRNINNGWARLYLTNCGEVRLKYHRELPTDAEIKMILIKRDKSGKWWACLQIDFEQITEKRSIEKAVGIDVGLVHVLALSDGQTVDSPYWYTEKLRKQRILNRKLDRQRRANNPQNYNENGTNKEDVLTWNKSTRLKETERQFRNLSEKSAQQRQYWWHTITDYLTKEYDEIIIEDLTLDFMIKNKRLAMKTLDASLGTFWQQLTYKCQERGIELIKVPPQYTSQRCSRCGYVDSDNRKTQAEFKCIECGHVENADLNAAKNILLAGADASVGQSVLIGAELPYKVL